MTHNEAIERYILEHGYITSNDAIDKLPKRCTRLSARIFEIEHESGIKFDRVRQQNKETWWVEYHLPQTMREKAREAWQSAECSQKQ